jgi:hypothetical protein
LRHTDGRGPADRPNTPAAPRIAWLKRCADLRIYLALLFDNGFYQRPPFPSVLQSP